jgi:mannosyltransferase
MALDRWDKAALAAVSSLSLLLTLPRLRSRDVWLDEALTIGATAELGETIQGTGGTMALYYALVWPIAQVTHDRFWLRLPSAVLVVGVVILTYLIGRRIAGRWTAVAASTVLASSWALARWGVEARGYALAMVLVAASWLALLEATRAADDPARRRRWWWAFGLAVALAPLAHGLAALQLPVQLALLALRPDRRAWLRRSVPVVLAWAGVGAGLMALGAGEVADWIGPLELADLVRAHRMLVGRGAISLVVAALVLVGTASSVAAFVRASDRARSWERLAVVGWAWGVPLLVLAISLVRPYQEARYLVTSLPGVALVVALGLERVPRAPRALRPLALGMVAAVLLSMQPAVTSSYGEDWPGVVELIAAEAAPGDGLVIRPLLRAPFDHALDELDLDPTLDPVAPPDAFGPPKRFYVDTGDELRPAILAADRSTLWVVSRGTDARRAMEALRDDPAVTDRYEIAEGVGFRGRLVVYRLRCTAVSC